MNLLLVKRGDRAPKQDAELGLFNANVNWDAVYNAGDGGCFSLVRFLSSADEKW